MPADRTMHAGDSWPPVKGQATDAEGNVLNLTGYTLAAVFAGGGVVITAPATAIWPPEADPDGIHHWNWEATLTSSETTVVAKYTAVLKVTYAPGQIQTFPDDGTASFEIIP